MRILVIQTTDWVRRNPAQQHHLVELLSLRGHEIRVIDFELLWRIRRDGIFSARRILKGFHKIHKGAKVTVIRPSFIRLPLADYLSIVFSQYREIHRQLAEFRPDVVLSFGVIAYLAGKIAKRFGLPFVYYWIDVTHLLIPVKLLQPIGLLMERRALKLADKIFVINKKLGEYVIRNAADPKKVVVLGAGIYLEKFEPSLDGSEIRRRYGIGKNDLVLFFMGWLYKFSGLKEVSLQIVKSNRNIKLLIVGDGELYNELQEVKTKYDKDGKIILCGKRPYEEMPHFISAADICLLPAYPNEKIMQDIVPIKVYEYMAMGKPVLATKLPGVLMEFGVDSGIIFVEKPEDVVEKAAETVQGNGLRILGIKARRTVEKYDWHRIASEFEKHLEDLIRTRTVQKR